jgi:predicted transcriptional regulator
MTAEDLEIELSRLVEKLKVEEGLEASAQGNTISHEEVKQRMARWISE